MDAKTMLEILGKASKEAIAEFPSHAPNTLIHSQDYTIGMQCVAEAAAHKVFGFLMIDRPLGERLGDVLLEYTKQYGSHEEGLKALKVDLKELSDSVKEPSSI